MQLMLLEQSSPSNSRPGEDKQEERSPSSKRGGGNHALQDYQMQLMLLEQQNKKRLFMARKEIDFLDEQQVGEGGSGSVVRTEGQSRERAAKGRLPEVIDEREYPIYRFC